MKTIYKVQSKHPHRVVRIFTDDVAFDGIVPAHSVGIIVASINNEARGEYLAAPSPQELLAKIKARLTQGGVQDFTLVEHTPDDFSGLYPLVD